MENKQTGNRVRLGIFVSIAIALFIFVIYFIGNRQNLFTKTFHVKSVFKDLGGLQVGNNVRFTGLNVGTINTVEIISDSTVMVDMMIKKHIQKFMRADAIATIGSEGLMGNKVINLLPGSPGTAMIKDGGIVKTITPVSIDDIMKNLEATTRNAAVITGDITVLTTSARTGKGAIGRIFMDSTFSQNLSQTMVNAKKATGGLNENMEAAKHNFLLKGYFKKKERKAAEKAKEAEKEKAKKQ